MRPKAATVATVADRAGVSVATVSRVMNGNPRVDPALAARVLEAVSETGFVPSRAARSLRSQATGQLALVVDDIGNSAYVDIMDALQEVADENGYRLLVHSTEGSEDDQHRVLEGLARRYADGVVLTSLRWSPETLRLIAALPVPAVVLGWPPETAQVDCVSSDARAGAAAAAAHLVAQGCERLAMVNLEEGTVPARTRLQGYRDGCRAAGADPGEVHHVASDPDRAHQVATRLLERPARPDGIFCANDLLAIGVLHACLDLGLDVPGDVKVVGVDDSRHALMTRPRLSSVDLRFAERGRIAGAMLLARLSGGLDAPPRRIRLDAPLVVRGSSVAAGAGQAAAGSVPARP